MRKVVGATVVAVGLAFGAGVAKAEFGPAMQIPGTSWVMEVNKEDAMCAITAHYTGGYSLGVIQKGDAWVVVLINNTLKLQPGNTYQVWFDFGGGVIRGVKLEADSATVMAGLVDAKFITAMSRANGVSLVNEHGVTVAALTLTGSSKALSVLGTCADSLAAPFGQGKPNQATPFGNGKERGA